MDIQHCVGDQLWLTGHGRIAKTAPDSAAKATDAFTLKVTPLLRRPYHATGLLFPEAHSLYFGSSTPRSRCNTQANYPVLAPWSIGK